MKAMGNPTPGKVIELFPTRPPLGHYIRVGTTGHQQLETLLESGRLVIDRAVFDASVAPRQNGLVQALEQHGAELILDTDVAELSSRGRFEGIARQAPWAIQGRPMRLDDFRGAGGMERISQIAIFAIEHQFGTVLSPTHLLDNAEDSAFNVDRETTEKLRAALDAAGGQHIRIDYALLVPNKVLKDPRGQQRLRQGLKGLPIDNLWIRTSGFGAGATPTGVVRYIRALREFVALGYPIIADGAAGFAGLAAAAFGSASGICHGVGIYEGFDASEWNKPRKVSAGGGQPRRVLIPSLDRQLTIKQLEAIIAVQNGRRLVSCNDRHCCPKGFEDMQRDPKAHYCYQRRVSIDALSKIPEPRRAEHFVHQDLAAADRRARLLAKIRIQDSDTSKLVQESSHRVEKLYQVLEHFLSEDGFVRRAAPIGERRGRPKRAAGGDS